MSAILSTVIPRRRSAANPESRDSACVSGFRVRAFGASRNDNENSGEVDR